MFYISEIEKNIPILDLINSSHFGTKLLPSANSERPTSMPLSFNENAKINCFKHLKADFLDSLKLKKEIPPADIITKSFVFINQKIKQKPR